MTDRRHWLERTIEDAMPATLSDLEGAGRPLTDLSQEYDPTWWARKFMAKERALDRADALRREIRRLLPRALATSDQERRRQAIERLDALIEAANRELPPSDRVARLDVDELVAKRR